MQAIQVDKDRATDCFQHGISDHPFSEIEYRRREATVLS
jgi:hypothetical protein